MEYVCYVVTVNHDIASLVTCSLIKDLKSDWCEVEKAADSFQSFWRVYITSLDQY
jgi:hypothetical protein